MQMDIGAEFDRFKLDLEQHSAITVLKSTTYLILFV